jgi:hypothetical protein
MLLHYLFTFFKATLTVPKIKDLVHVPAKKYEDIMNIIDSSSSYSEEQYYLPKKQTTQQNVTTTTSYEKPDVDNMKNELKSFLKDKMSSNSNTTDISSLDSFSQQQQQQYSLF